MPNPHAIQIDAQQDILCPVCGLIILDSDELRPQPSCEHVRFVYCNGDCFEYCAPELEALLAEEVAKADEQNEFFDMWEALQRHCGPDDLILEQTTEEMACGPVSFTVWVGIKKCLAHAVTM